MAGQAATLSCEGVDVSFGDVQVLRSVDLQLVAGECHVLIGPNGAGKTTLANVVTGHVMPDRGTVWLDSAPLEGRPWRRARRGLGRKFQIPRVFPRLTAAENLNLAERSAGGGEFGALADRKAEELSHGEKQWLELRMTLAQRPSLVVLDEPTAGMPRTDRSELAAEILGLRGSTTLLVVEHDLDFVADIADRVSFMHEGRLRLTGTFDELRADPLVQAVYLGEVVA